MLISKFVHILYMCISASLCFKDEPTFACLHVIISIIVFFFCIQNKLYVYRLHFVLFGTNVNEPLNHNRYED